MRRAASSLKKFSGTMISKSFISRRHHSWQAHLERISPYLVNGKSVWWHETDEDYHFLDGATDPECHSEGSQLLHYRSSTLKDVTHRQKDCWQTILRKSTEIPLQTINIYDKGQLSHTIHDSHTPIENSLTAHTPKPPSTEPSSTVSEIPSLLDNPRLIPAGKSSEFQDHIEESIEQISITDPEAQNSPEQDCDSGTHDIFQPNPSYSLYCAKLLPRLWEQPSKTTF